MNEVIDFPKIKKPKGKIKIELFDDLTGKKIEEVHSTNFIAKGVEYAYKLRMLGLFTRKRKTGGADTTNLVRDLFSRMILTNAEHAEDPVNEWLVKGKIIGYAYTDETYVGTDTLRGSYNEKESFTNKDKVHIVIDFPTNAANGTFSSIYFCEKGGSPLDLDDSYGYSDYFKRKTELNHGLERRYGMEKFVVSDVNKIIITDDNLKLESEVPLDFSIGHFDVVGNTLYYIKSSNKRVIYKATLPTLTDEVQVATYNYNLYAIAYDSARERFYVTCYDFIDGSSQTVLLVYDKTFNLLDVKKGLGIYIDNIIVIDGFLFNSSSSRSYNSVNTSYLDLDSFETYPFKMNNSKTNIFNADSTKMYLKTSNDNMLVLPKIYIGSRSLLDAPVTKTETNTMKITYDFILPPIL